MDNPFENADATYLVLVNDEGQYSLWPQSVGVPGGWAVVLDRAPRQVCVEYIKAHWIDMRPRSLVDAMDG
ncbi:MbtH family protein [Streptomyces sp. NPDC006733]|uniref:MbtH family protein n=1 Tax=Streptomyces sp. NPDC006733 TaxID=3155460 RepID=UPI0033ED1B49